VDENIAPANKNRMTTSFFLLETHTVVEQ